ncbi:unnamed protein product [Paramecium primaurelia]|uniref:Uncharacterized protein n=1 Tax=Paramecium primaurelia TaxID=5886 RepID=A0A8S1L2U2_PARPR|nr:unnamed protein product [Paramecium primaurelia]
MKQIVLFAFLACVVLAHNDIKHVQELLLELKDEIHEQIVALDAEWLLTQKMKQASIQALRQTKVDQEADCDRRDENVINKKTEIQEMSDLIAWIQHRIHVNKNRIQTIEDLQCRQSILQHKYKQIQIKQSIKIPFQQSQYSQIFLSFQILQHFVQSLDDFYKNSFVLQLSNIQSLIINLLNLFEISNLDFNSYFRVIIIFWLKNSLNIYNCSNQTDLYNLAKLSVVILSKGFISSKYQLHQKIIIIIILKKN